MPAFVKNLLDDKPHRDLHGAQIFSRAWVDHSDLKDRRILDIGCGFGWFDLVALDAGAAHVTGIEPVEGDLATARGFFDDRNASFAVGSAIEIPFEDASFDTVVCWEVLEHIPKHHEPQAFREIHRVLRPGGVFYMSTPHDSPVIKFGDPAWWVAGHRHYTRERLQGFASGARPRRRGAARPRRRVARRRDQQPVRGEVDLPPQAVPPAARGGAARRGLPPRRGGHRDGVHEVS